MIVAARGASLHIYVDFYCISSCSILMYKTNSFGAWLWWMWCTRQIGCYMYWAACDMCLCIFMWHVDTIWALNIVLICAKNCIFSILNCSVEQSVAVNVWSVGWSDGECVVTDYLSLKSGNRLSIAVNIHCNRLSVAKSTIWRKRFLATGLTASAQFCHCNFLASVRLSL